MRRIFLCGLSLLAVVQAWGKPLPLTAKDVGLMLRTGDSSEMVMRELATKRFADEIDPAKEKLLVEAGATPALVEALKNGSYAVSAEELAAAKEEQSRQEQRKALVAQESRKFNSVYQDKVAREREDASRRPFTGNVIETAAKGNLVRSQNGTLVPDNNAPEGKKIFALYFSAQWCGPCRQFTPQLVDYYNRVAPKYPAFEIVFVSADRSAPAMAKYMRDFKMPWPGLDYEKIKQKPEITKYAGKGIPCLVVVDPAGRVISSTYDGEKYLGPAKVLADLDAVFAETDKVRVSAIR